MLHYISFVYSPFSWIVLLLILAYFRKAQRKKLLLACFVVIVVFTNPLLYGTFLKMWEVDTSRMEDLPAKFDVGIVLGGYLWVPEGTQQIHFGPSGNRLLAALQLYRAGKIKRILLSGGFYDLHKPELMEAPVIKDFLLKNKVPEQDILMDASSSNTYENAVNTKKLLGTSRQPNLLISSNYHLRRAKACFEKVGMEVTPFACGASFGSGSSTLGQMFIPTVNVLVKWKGLFHEILGWQYYNIRGYL